MQLMVIGSRAVWLWHKSKKERDVMPLVSRDECLLPWKHFSSSEVAILTVCGLAALGAGLPRSNRIGFLWGSLTESSSLELLRIICKGHPSSACVHK